MTWFHRRREIHIESSLIDGAWKECWKSSLFLSFDFLVAVACACKRIILGRKINNIRFMLIDLKFFPALLSRLLACNCQRGLGFYVRKTARSSLNQPPWGQIGPVFPTIPHLSLFFLYLRLPHAGFLSGSFHLWPLHRLLPLAYPLQRAALIK